MTAKKYEIVTRNSIVHNGKKLYKIRALKDFVNVLGEQIRTGELGGYVQSEDNLSQEGDCWIFGKAKVYDDAKVFDNACVYGTAEVFDKAEICDNACVSGSAKIYGNAKIYDNAYVCNAAEVYGNAEIFDEAQICDYSQVYENAIVSSATWVFGNARIYGNAKICEKAEIYGNAEVKGNVFIYGDATVCCVAKISGNKKVKTGKYIVKSLNIDEAFNEIKPVCDKIDFINKAILCRNFDLEKSNFPVEGNYTESLISQFAEYSELADFFYIHGCIGFTSKEMEIYDLLLQCRKIYEKLKVKIDK